MPAANPAKEEEAAQEGEESCPNSSSEINNKDDDNNSTSNKNDLVIRDGFPALKRADGKGPLIDGDEPIPRHAFSSYEHALEISEEQMEIFREDCTTVFTARTRDDDAAYSTGITYFVPCQMAPRCALEGLALEVFHSHVKDIAGMYNPEQSGAEWWTLVMDATKSDKGESKTDDDDDDGDEDDEVGMHFDADYGLESQLPHMLLHPRVATVTYLSNVGAPTIVLNKRGPAPTDIEKESLNGEISSGWLSGPRLGKHIAFDGRLLHGAPALFFPGNEFRGNGLKNSEHEPHAKRVKLDEPDSDKRITFLVNIWLNHCPLDAELLDEDVLEQLKTPWEVPKGDQKRDNVKGDTQYKPPFEWKIPNVSYADNNMDKATLTASSIDPAGSDEHVICNRLVTFMFGSTMDDLHKASSATAGGRSLELEFRKGALSLVVGDEVKDDDDEDSE